MINCIKYFFRPRYVVIKGIQIEDRAIMYLGANVKYSKDCYNNTVLTFSNNKHQQYSSYMYTRIWTWKGLLKWRRLLGSSTKVVSVKYFRRAKPL